MSIQTVTLADEAFKRAFIEGKLVIDCVEIKLTQNIACNPMIYTSSGYLHVSPADGIEARLVDPQLVDPIKQFMQSFETKSGEIFPESHYYSLEARDVAGNLWRNPMVQLKLTPYTTCTVLGVSCDYIRCEFEKKSSAETWTHMVFLDELDFPMNGITEKNIHVRDKILPTLASTISSGKAGGMLLKYHNETGDVKYSELYAEADQGITFPSAFQHRLLEAVQFVTATFVSWIMNETFQNGIRTLEVTSLRSANKGMIPEPLNPRGYDKDFYLLLDRYFQYSLGNAQDENFAPLSTKLGGLYPLKGVWLDTIALMVGVAVESVLNDFSEIAKPDSILLNEVTDISKAIAATSVRDNTKTRALGSVSGMKSSRALDKLKFLAGIDVITDDDISQWKRLRNTTAHGTLHVDPRLLQRLLNDIYGAMTLVYKLVFLRIGYDGQYSDYSQIGWPIKAFKASCFKVQISAPSYTLLSAPPTPAADQPPVLAA